MGDYIYIFLYIWPGGLILTHAHMAVGQNQWYHFGVGAPPILSIVVGMGMFTGGTGFGF